MRRFSDVWKDFPNERASLYPQITGGLLYLLLAFYLLCISQNDPSLAPPEGRGARMPGMSEVELYVLGWHNPLF